MFDVFEIVILLCSIILYIILSPFHYFTKNNIRYFISALGVICIITLQIVKYNETKQLEHEKQIIKEEKQNIEKELALTLFAMAEKNFERLKKMTKEDYILGYCAFKLNDFVTARNYFNSSIEKNKYVSSSKYLLAYMLTHPQNELQIDSDGIDWSRAFDYLGQVIEDDPSYPQAYYLRAILNANSRQLEHALDDLERAVGAKEHNFAICFDLKNDDEVEKKFDPIRNEERFKVLREKCEKILETK